MHQLLEATNAIKLHSHILLLNASQLLLFFHCHVKATFINSSIKLNSFEAIVIVKQIQVYFYDSEMTTIVMGSSSTGR